MRQSSRFTEWTPFLSCVLWVWFLQLSCWGCLESEIYLFPHTRRTYQIYIIQETMGFVTWTPYNVPTFEYFGLPTTTLEQPQSACMLDRYDKHSTSFIISVIKIVHTIPSRSAAHVRTYKELWYIHPPNRRGSCHAMMTVPLSYIVFTMHSQFSPNFLTKRNLPLTQPWNGRDRYHSSRHNCHVSLFNFAMFQKFSHLRNVRNARKRSFTQDRTID